MPSQKEGVETPTSTVTVMSLSSHAFCRTAAMMPSGMPTIAQSTSDAPASSMVGPRRPITSSSTGLCRM